MSNSRKNTCNLRSEGQGMVRGGRHVYMYNKEIT